MGRAGGAERIMCREMGFDAVWEMTEEMLVTGCRRSWRKDEIIQVLNEIK